MNWFLIGLFFFSHSLWAQSLVSDLEKINQELGQAQVDEYLKTPSGEGISGTFLSTLLPTTNIDPKSVCEVDGEPKKTRYEVIIVAEANNQEAKIEELERQRLHFSQDNLSELFSEVKTNKNSEGLTKKAIDQRTLDIWNSGLLNSSNEIFDRNSTMGRELYVEGLIREATKSNLSENDLARQMASVIGETYKTDEERYNVLSSLSMRLYRNYNNARNPGSNNSEFNPDGTAIPKGDLTMQEMLQAAVDFDVLSGGVCNDISETVAMVGEHLFPDKDVLVVNSGTHFGVLVADGKSTRIIDGSTSLKMENQLLLNPEMTPTNLRINKVVNGALKEIAVVDTQMGQLTEAAFQTGKKLLKTDVDISSLMAHFKSGNFGVTVGTGKLTDSKVLVVVAKYETSGDKWKTHLGVGGTGQDYNMSEMKNKYQVHFRAGVERSMFRYVNSQTSINYSTGVRMNGMYALNQDLSGSVNQIDLSAGMELVNRFDMTYGRHNPDGVQIRSSVEIEHAAGAKNWGNATGAMSNESGKDYGELFKNLTFHLNQINANVSAEKTINPKVTSFTSASYQGSNIGQSVNLLTGLDIKAPDGAQILVFTGYANSDFKGYQTQHSLLVAPTGLQVGGSYKTKKGIEVGGAVRGIAGETSVNGTLKININKKKRR